MTERKQPSRGYQKINPDDFLYYEEEYIKKGGGGSGAKSSGRKGKKTIKALVKQQRDQSRAGRRSELEASIKNVLKNLPIVMDQELQEKYLTRYISWIQNNKRTLAAPDPSDLVLSFSKSGGPGGQNVNKRETKVALMHQPTCIQVDNDQTRSQLQNKELAVENLMLRLQDHINDWNEYLDRDQIIDLEMVKTLLDDEG